MAAILFSKWPPIWQLFRNKMLRQIRGHWYKPPYPFFSVILIILIKKLIKLSWNRLSEKFYSCVGKKISRPTERAQHWYCLQNFVQISFLAHLAKGELLPLLGVRRLSSVNFSHFNLLLWNPSTIWTETW